MGITWVMSRIYLTILNDLKQSIHGTYPPIVICIHTSKELDPTAQEERMGNEVGEKIDELDRCIECGCCVTGCATTNVRDDFLWSHGTKQDQSIHDKSA